MYSADCVLSLFFGTPDFLNMGSVSCHPNVCLVDQVDIFSAHPLLRVRELWGQLILVSGLLESLSQHGK